MTADRRGPLNRRADPCEADGALRVSLPATRQAAIGGTPRLAPPRPCRHDCGQAGPGRAGPRALPSTSSQRTSRSAGGGRRLTHLARLACTGATRRTDKRGSRGERKKSKKWDRAGKNRRQNKRRPTPHGPRGGGWARSPLAAVGRCRPGPDPTRSRLGEARPPRRGVARGRLQGTHVGPWPGP